MNKTQFKEIVTWQDKTFGEATPQSKLAHLDEELIELKEAIEAGSADQYLEFADCFLLLFGAAAKAGMSYDDICEAIDSKMEINKKRKWGKPDKNGVVKHINHE